MLSDARSAPPHVSFATVAVRKPFWIPAARFSPARTRRIGSWCTVDATPELESFVAAGLRHIRRSRPPREMPPSFSRMNEGGTIEVGKRADLVLLSPIRAKEYSNTSQLKQYRWRRCLLGRNLDQLIEQPARVSTARDVATGIPTDTPLAPPSYPALKFACRCSRVPWPTSDACRRMRLSIRSYREAAA